MQTSSKEKEFFLPVLTDGVFPERNIHWKLLLPKSCFHLHMPVSKVQFKLLITGLVVNDEVVVTSRTLEVVSTTRVVVLSSLTASHETKIYM